MLSRLALAPFCVCVFVMYVFLWSPALGRSDGTSDSHRQLWQLPTPVGSLCGFPLPHPGCAPQGSGAAAAVSLVIAVARIQSLAWKLPHATGAAIKKEKRNWMLSK